MVLLLFCAMFVIAAGFYCKNTIIRFALWMRKKYERAVLILKMLNNIAEAQKPTQASFVINDSDESASIVYKHNGINHTLFVPFARPCSIKMTCIQVTLSLANGTKIDITQEPGIPYLCSAVELGGEVITAYNMDTGTSHTYAAEKPMFCQEVL